MDYLQELDDGGNGLLGGDNDPDVVYALDALLAGPLPDQLVPLLADGQGAAQRLALDEDGVHGGPNHRPELGKQALAAGRVVGLGADGLNQSGCLDGQAGLAAQSGLHFA